MKTSPSRTLAVVSWAPAAILILPFGCRAPAQPPAGSPEAQSAPPAAGTIDFAKDIQPILKTTCTKCHGPEKQKGKLRLDVRARALKGGESGAVIVPGRGAESLLVKRLAPFGDKDVMPKEGKPLSAEKIARIRAWIDQGAVWPDAAAGLDVKIETHWAYAKPVRPKVPGPKSKVQGPPATLDIGHQTLDIGHWTSNPIDAFVLARLEKEGLAPSPEASRETLIRRASLDLIGLPPTIEEVDAFVADPSPDAYAKAVDRLLASLHFGERWARPWLDAARYADTNGYEKDLIRTLWPWRDWVIDALNRNMPFDQFTIEQLAGDLLAPTGPERSRGSHVEGLAPTGPDLSRAKSRERSRGSGVEGPNPARGQLIATGFNRNTLLNDEGGVDYEEFRTAAVMDRVDTIGTIWLGTTIGCCQCHSHKFDPFTNKEYYQLYAFFNNTEDSANNKPEPLLEVPNPEQGRRLDRLRGDLADREAALKAVEARWAEAMAAWEERARAAPALLAPPTDGLVAHYPLDEADGAQVADASGQNPPAVYRGAPAPAPASPAEPPPAEAQPPGGAGPLGVPGRLGNAVHLDGKGGYLDCGDVADFDRADAFSFGGWAKWDGKDGAFIARMKEADAFRGFDLLGGNGARLQFHFVSHWPDNALAGSTKESLPVNTWFHVMVVYDGTGKAAGVTVYVNGVPRAMDMIQDSLKGSIKTDVPLRLGRRHESVFLNGALDDVRIYRRTLAAEEVARVMAAAYRPILDLPAAQRTDAQKSEIAALFRDHFFAEAAALKAEIARLRKEEEGIAAQAPKTMIMRERPSPRETHVLVRGNWAQPGDKVEPATPDSLHPFPPDLPKNRLGLAKWLVSPENPLVARVTVNRFWREIFGRGLVETTEDFGAQGERPTHPELLDWLATEFVRTGWDVKALLKTIVTSATYRQSSAVSAELFARDQYNVLLARGPRFRPDAETVRDLALKIGGRLNPAIGGPSVYPPQPPGIWENSFSFYDTKDRWVDETGPNRYRRGLYTFWRRSAPYPTMLTFDVTTRDVCVVKRNRTNTPLQALDTLNNPVFYECAAGLGRRMMSEAPGGAAEKIAYGFRLCTARKPRPEEAKRLEQVYADALERFAKDEPAAAALIAKGRIESGALDPKELAAWIVVGNVLLNLDETITKG